jgi:hypothetical protein
MQQRSSFWSDSREFDIPAWNIEHRFEERVRYRQERYRKTFCGISPFDVASSHSGKISEPTRRATAWPRAKLLPSEKWIPSTPSVDIISPASRNAI